MMQSKVSGRVASKVLAISDAVMGSLTRGRLHRAPTHAMSWRRIVMCGVWRDRNESDGLPRIQKYVRAAKQVSMVDGARPSAQRKATKSVTFSGEMGKGREGKSYSDGLVALSACSIGLSGGWSEACLQKLLNSSLYCRGVQSRVCWHKVERHLGGRATT